MSIVIKKDLIAIGCKKGKIVCLDCFYEKENQGHRKVRANHKNSGKTAFLIQEIDDEQAIICDECFNLVFKKEHPQRIKPVQEKPSLLPALFS